MYASVLFDIRDFGGPFFTEPQDRSKKVTADDIESHEIIIFFIISFKFTIYSTMEQ
jgi:hypothetical protein